MIFLIILGEILIHFFGGFYVWGKKTLVFAFPFSFSFFWHFTYIFFWRNYTDGP